MEAAAAALEADAPVDEVDALAARIEEIDELGPGNHIYGCGRVLTALIRDADVEGVRAHLELLDYHDEAVSAHQLAMAARLPYKVHYGDAAVCRRSREVLLLLVEAGAQSSGCDNTCIGQPDYASDGYCDDGGPGADYSDCDLGTDCADCGPRVMPPPAPPPPLPLPPA